MSSLCGIGQRERKDTELQKLRCVLNAFTKCKLFVVCTVCFCLVLVCLFFYMYLQSSTDPVLAADFHPCEKNIIVTCGKGQISFWNMEGGTLSRKQGIYEVWTTESTNRKESLLRQACSHVDKCHCRYCFKKIYSSFLQKHDKPKFVTCLAFAENGDTLTGDSNGNIFVWGRGRFRYIYI